MEIMTWRTGIEIMSMTGFTDKDIMSLREYEKQLDELGITEDDKGEMLSTRIRNLMVYTQIKETYGTQVLLSDEVLYIVHNTETNENTDYDTVYESMITEEMKNVLKICFHFNDKDIENVLDFEQTICGLGITDEDDRKILIRKRIKSLKLLMDATRDQLSWLISTEIEAILEKCPDNFDLEFLEYINEEDDEDYDLL